MSATEPPLVQTRSSSLDRSELLARAVSGVVMAVAAVAGVAGGGVLFSAIAAVTAMAALREWHRLINGGPRHGISPEMLVTVGSVIVAVVLIHVRHEAGLPTLIVGTGGVVAGLIALARKKPAALHMLGAAYIGGPALALVALRHDYEHGGWIVLGVFAAVWAADIGALFFGQLIGGPKLAPVLSPHKTWAGFVGGIAAGAAAEVLYIVLLGGLPGRAFVFGVLLALAGNMGDLFESWIKRMFRAKNSGGLIPGHGGVLDRIDSLLFAAPFASGLVFLLGFDPLVGITW
ncbi:MAG: phosphatidate cytidylyltransferase [Alphaproteobacteria bacterium]